MRSPWPCAWVSGPWRGTRAGASPVPTIYELDRLLRRMVGATLAVALVLRLGPDTQAHLMQLLSFLRFLDQTYQQLQFLDGVFRVALVALVAIRGKLHKPGMDIILSDVVPLGIGLQA